MKTLESIITPKATERSFICKPGKSITLYTEYGAIESLYQPINEALTRDFIRHNGMVYGLVKRNKVNMA